jgi:hypothetical protein
MRSAIAQTAMNYHFARRLRGLPIPVLFGLLVWRKWKVTLRVHSVVPE